MMKEEGCKTPHLAILASLTVVAAFAVHAKTVVVADITGSEKDVSVFEAAVKDAGHEVKRISGGNEIFAKEETYAGADVIVLTGGWGSLMRNDIVRQIVRFAAKGGGVFLGAFRSGPVRTFTHPPFPEIACTYNRADSPWLWAEGDSPLAKAMGDKPVLFGGFDHLALKVGENGNVFAKSGDDAVGVYGEFGLGRVVVFGMFVSVPADDESAAVKQGIYKAMVEYLAGSSSPASDDERRNAADAAVAAFDRRMTVWEWTHDERGSGRRPGNIPALRDNTVVPVESKAMLLEFFARELKDKALAGNCGELAKRVREVSNAIRALAAKRVNELISDDSRLLEVAKDPKAAEAALKSEFAALAAKSPAAEADALVEKARMSLRAQRKAERAAEHADDIKAIPSIVARLSSPDSAIRLDAATELGRIGEATPEVVAALVKALDDADDKVRVQSVISLGWMQAKDAVPALIAKARQNKDLPLKRRAIQALGQIGDDRAIPAILPALDSIDRYTVENAMLALGYLKAKEAVPRLIGFASDESKPVKLVNPTRKRVDRMYWDVGVMNSRGCAITALGHIGDKAAVAVLEKIKDENKPEPGDGILLRANGINSGNCGASLNMLAKDALAAIAAGGRKERGVRQPEAWSSKDVFYGITRCNNALVGRISTVLGKMEAFKGDREDMFLPYILDAGMTGIHGAWGGDFCMSEAGAERVVREMDDYGLKFIGTAPSGGFATIRDINRPAQEMAFEKFGALTSYAGIWSEEDWSTDFHGFKLTNEDPNPAVCGLGAAARAARVARVEAAGAEQEDRWREVQDWLHARRKGFAMTFSVTQGNFYDEAMGTPAIMERFDTTGPERYESFGRNNAYLIERFRNGETRSVMTEYYNWYATSMDHVLRGCWQNAMRSKCYYPFSLNQFSPFTDWYASWTWDKGRWEKYAEVYRHVRDYKDLYAVAPSVTEVAVLLSERTAVSFRHTALNAQSAVPEATDEAGLAIWTLLSQSHLNADVVFVDNATDKKLSKYKVLFLTTAKILAEREQDMLRRWVAAGGTLVCEGTVSLFDPKNLMLRGNYAIADLLGVNYVKTEFAPTKEVYGQRNGSLNGKVVFPVYQGLDNFFRFSEFVWRDVKPMDCIAVANGKGYGPVEYDAALGIDKVELTSANAVQVFDDGSPALTENEYGRGRVYFFTAMCPSYGHVTSRWEMNANKFDFWTGVRETYEKIARDGLARVGSAPAVDLVCAPKDLDMAVYSQNDGKRLVIHLLDYDTTRAEISGVTLKINGDSPIKAVYRPGAKPLAPTGRSVRLGVVKAYDMVVVDFE